MRIIVTMEGGLVQGILSDSPDVEVAVIDYDTEGADGNETIAIPQSSDGKTTEQAFAGIRSVEVDAERTDQLFAAINTPDVCMAGEPALAGICGDPECVCHPSKDSAEQRTRTGNTPTCEDCDQPQDRCTCGDNDWPLCRHCGSNLGDDDELDQPDEETGICASCKAEGKS